jgi:hypothetical protein
MYDYSAVVWKHARVTTRDAGVAAEHKITTQIATNHQTGRPDGNPLVS